jgi:hypothetical protein
MANALLREALQLDRTEKVKLIDMLTESLLTDSEKKVEEKWAHESQRRYDAYRAGDESAIDYAEIKK